MPGLGKRTVERLLAARRHRAIRAADLARLRLPTARLLPFVVTADRRPHGTLLDRADLRRLVAPETPFAARPAQLALF